MGLLLRVKILRWKYGTPTTDPAVTWWIAFTSRLSPKQRDGGEHDCGNDVEFVDDAICESSVIDELDDDDDDVCIFNWEFWIEN